MVENPVFNKVKLLISDTRVMTLAVCEGSIPWSSPVYFVYHEHRFYFFSNKNSTHILQRLDKKQVAASIFNDSDQIDQIFLDYRCQEVLNWFQGQIII